MENANNCLTMDDQRTDNGTTNGPSVRLDRNPDRKVWEDRKLALQFELEELDRTIREDELAGACMGSALVTSRGELLNRLEDLEWLIARCG